MEAPPSFKEALVRISCRLHRTLTLNSLPFQFISQNYKTSGCIAQHEGVPHPVGTLFILHREHEMHLSAGVGGESSQEETMNNGTHTVLASYGGHACARTFSISTSHALCSSSCIKLYYANNLRGDSFCSVRACHSFNEEFLLSSSYAEGLSSDPAFGIEFEQEKKYNKVTGTLVKNLRSGLHQLHIQSSALLPAELTLKNSVSTDFQGHGYSGLEVAWASNDTSCMLRALLGMDGRREFAVRGSQNFLKATHVEVLASTTYDAQNIFSLKLEHKASKEKKVSMNVMSTCSSIQEVSIMASLAQQRRSWKWKYRKVDNEGHLLGLECQFRGDSDGVSSLSIEAGHHGIAVNGEFSHFF